MRENIYDELELTNLTEENKSLLVNFDCVNKNCYILI